MEDEEDHKYMHMPLYSNHTSSSQVELVHVNNQEQKIVAINDANNIINRNQNNNNINNNNRRTSFAVEFPPGYRFCPSDGELIVHYLCKKINNEELPHDRIKDVNIYKSNPQDLAANYEPVGDKEWYFFTPRDRKYRNGSRPNRAAGNGYWKATGADKTVRHNSERVGLRKALVFYQGKPPKGDKTNWIMHEYRDMGPQRTRTDSHDMRLDDWVLCRIYHKDDKDSKVKAQSEGIKQEQRVGSVFEEKCNPAMVESNSCKEINTFGDQMHHQQPCLPNVFPQTTTPLMDSLFLGYANSLNGFHQSSMFRQTQFSSWNNTLMEEATWDTFDNIMVSNSSCDPLSLLNNITDDNSYLDFESEDPPTDPRNIHSEHEQNRFRG